MGDVKPWQLILMIAAIGVLGFSVWNFGFKSKGDLDLLADSVVMIDVTTGDLFEFSLKGRRGVVVPAVNPDTGTRTLIPVEPGPEGQGWSVSERNLNVLRSLEVQISAIDRSTGRATPSGQTPKRIRN